MSETRTNILNKVVRLDWRMYWRVFFLLLPLGPILALLILLWPPMQYGVTAWLFVFVAWVIIGAMKGNRRNWP